ncbi:MAG: murein transglycosylase domain-containing protein [Thermodesulfobacteriota bacterium]
MDRRDFLWALALSPFALIAGCKTAHISRVVTAGTHLARGSVSGAAASAVPGSGIAGVDSLMRGQLRKLLDALFEQWGDEKVPSRKEYVKYTDDYQTRAIIDFESGRIRVETVETDNPRQKLETAIVHTLLTPENPAKVDLLSDKQVSLGEKPFLFKLVLDQDEKPVRWEWRARRYANYLLRTAAHTDTYNNRKRHSVTFDMVKDHDVKQQNRYQAHVLRSSRRFDINPALIYAIIEVESSFNPYAVSHVPAYGLMQIVPETAGRDAYFLIHKRKATPTREYLFVPGNNIRMGAAYLHLLSRNYLKHIRDPEAKEFCVIAGYNTGSGNVLRAFAPDRDQAFERINSMDRHQVYTHLIRNLPYEETRNYLPKVVRAKRKYA